MYFLVANKFANLLFHETFDSLKDSVWNHEVKIPLTPDYEFCVYHNDQHSSIYVENGFLKIKPLILENLYGDNATTYGKLILNALVRFHQNVNVRVNRSIYCHLFCLVD